MRILRTLAWVLVALACAAPNCDTHDAPLGSGSGSSAWARMPSAAGSGSDAQHHDVVHAMETVTGAALEPAKPKPAKPRSATKRASRSGDTSGGGSYGETASTSSREPPPPALPESGRKLGQPCDDRDQCASHECEFDVCAKHASDLLNKGEQCDYDNRCASNRCHDHECE
jgi:hypothetical protein